MKGWKYKIYIWKKYFWLRVLHFFNKPDCKHLNNNHTCEYLMGTHNCYSECDYSKKHPCCFNNKLNTTAKTLKPELIEWLNKISDKGPHEEIIDHIKRHATEHITHEPFMDWLDSMQNMIHIYNRIYYRNSESIKNRYKVLENYKKKHNSEL